MNLAGRHALVVGLGKSGAAAARLLRSRGASDRGGRRRGGVRGRAAAVVPDSLRGIDLVVVSPGVPLSLALFAEARARKLEVIGEVELASRFIEEPLLGSPGPTARAPPPPLRAPARHRRPAVFTGGNLGTRSATGCSGRPPGCDRLRAVQLPARVHRLLALRSATVLNVTPDHLDRYPSLEAYAAAKQRIFQNSAPGTARPSTSRTLG